MKRLRTNGQKQLTQREKAFVENVAAGENQTKAVVKAGYSEKSAKVIGSQLASKAIIQDAIRARKNQAFDNHQLCAEMVVGGLNEIAFAPVDLLIDDNGSLDLSEAKRLGLTHLIKKIKVMETPFGQKTEIEFYSRLDALKKLADMGDLKLPQHWLEHERIRTSFMRTVQQYSEKHEITVEEALEFLLDICQGNNPDLFDTLQRVGIGKKSDFPT